MDSGGARLTLTPDVEKWWPIIEPGVAACLAINTNGAQPHHILQQLLNKELWLLIATRDDYEGFCVIKPQENRYTGDREIFIQLCYSVNKKFSMKFWLEEAIKRYKPHGVKKILFNSPRKGWKRLFENTMYVYEKVL